MRRQTRVAWTIGVVAALVFVVASAAMLRETARRWHVQQAIADLWAEEHGPLSSSSSTPPPGWAARDTAGKWLLEHARVSDLEELLDGLAARACSCAIPRVPPLEAPEDRPANGARLCWGCRPFYEALVHVVARSGASGISVLLGTCGEDPQRVRVAKYVLRTLHGPSWFVAAKGDVSALAPRVEDAWSELAGDERWPQAD